MDAAELSDYFRILDALRASGKMNMFGSAVALENAGLDGPMAKKIVVAWMESFSDELSALERADKTIERGDFV